MNTNAADIADIVDQVPALDKRGTFTGPSWEEAAVIFEAVLAAGEGGLKAVVGMLKDVDDGADYKARYVLHGLAQYLGRPGKEAGRTLFSKTLAAQVGGDRSKPVQGFLLRQLQVAGEAEAVPAIGRALADAELCEFAAQALLAIRAGAVEEFRKALPTADGARRRTVVQALGILSDAASAEAIRKAASDENADTRLLAVWALARIGDAGAVGLAIKASDAEPSFERIRAASNALLLAEKLLADGKKSEAATIYRHLRDSRKDDSEAYVREAAAEGLERAGG